MAIFNATNVKRYVRELFICLPSLSLALFTFAFTEPLHWFKVASVTDKLSKIKNTTVTCVTLNP